MNELKPCPFCGSDAKITRAEFRDNLQRITIACCGCGVELDWSQEFVVKIIPNLVSGTYDCIRMPLNKSAIEVWNERCDAE